MKQVSVPATPQLFLVSFYRCVIKNLKKRKKEKVKGFAARKWQSGNRIFIHGSALLSTHSDNSITSELRFLDLKPEVCSASARLCESTLGM